MLAFASLRMGGHGSEVQPSDAVRGRPQSASHPAMNLANVLVSLRNPSVAFAAPATGGITRSRDILSKKDALTHAIRAVSPAMDAAAVQQASMQADLLSADDEDFSASKTDWSFLNAAYLITCSSKDGSNPRLQSALDKLEAVGLGELTTVRQFESDDEDRIRGCYTSHIAILEEAAAKLERLPADQDANILVLEDNLALSPRIAQDTLDEISSFLSKPGASASGGPDMVHLAYIMYVPGLAVEKIEGYDHVVRLNCNQDSVLGTTAYIITRKGLKTLLAEHQRTGYVDAIPNMMARLFPDTRYASYPMVLHRAAKVPSLVNAQLDTLRAGLFLPVVYTKWEMALVSTGLSTNVLFPALLVTVLIGALGGMSEVIRELFALARGEDINLVLPLISGLASASCFLVLMYGLSLAPKPQPPSQL